MWLHNEHSMVGKRSVEMGLRILTQGWKGLEGKMLYPPMKEGRASCYMLMLSKYRASLEAESIGKKNN